MTARFKVGDHVICNSEAGRVRGRIVKVHTRNQAVEEIALAFEVRPVTCRCCFSQTPISAP